MPTTVIMPALELAQETGKVLKWLKAPGDRGHQGRADRRDRDRQGHGRDRGARGRGPARRDRAGRRRGAGRPDDRAHLRGRGGGRGREPRAGCRRGAADARHRRLPLPVGQSPAAASGVKASPLARKLAEQHGVDLGAIKTAERPHREGRRPRLRREPEGRRPATATRRRASPPRRRRPGGWRPSAASTSARSAARAPAAPCSPRTFRRPLRRRSRAVAAPDGAARWPRRPASATSGASWPSA